VTLCDTGPLVALVDDDDAHHRRCLAALPSLRPPLIATWPGFTEAMYLLRREGGYPAQAGLWALVTQDALRFHLSTAREAARMRELMDEYRDTPMDLADASVVAAAEALGVRRVFSLDHHFYIYRLNGTDTFEVLP
jgi:predicted nucleic acid-binding protein